MGHSKHIDVIYFKDNLPKKYSEALRLASNKELDYSKLLRKFDIPEKSNLDDKGLSEKIRVGVININDLFDEFSEIDRKLSKLIFYLRQ